MLPSSRYIRCAGYEIHCTEWGAPEAPVVIAWHGPARTGRDMDELAQHLSSRFRVICPDTIGRGLSQWSSRPAQEYCLAFYARIATNLFDQLGIQLAHWVGPSMGGGVFRKTCRWGQSPAIHRCTAGRLKHWRKA